MKFLIITRHGQFIVEAEDFEQAARYAWNDHTGYKDVYAIVKAEEDFPRTD